MTQGQQAPGTRILEHKGAPALVLRRTSLTVLSGPDAGREIAIEGTSVRVGSDPDNDLILADETVTAHHFEILATEGTAAVLHRSGIRSRVVRKYSSGRGADGEPTIVDLITAGDVDIVVNTPSGQGARAVHRI